jgi:hypothetical protein
VNLFAKFNLIGKLESIFILMPTVNLPLVVQIIILTKGSIANKGPKLPQYDEPTF